MEYVTVKNLEKYHPGYKDRELKWAKLYFNVIQGDYETEMLCEIDQRRLIAFIVLELQAKKPIPLDPEYLKRKGFDLKKRSILLTLNMLHNFVQVVTENGKDCSLEKSKIREDKEKIKTGVTKFVPPSIQEVISYFKEKGYSEKSAMKAHEYYDTGNWHDSKNNKVMNWKQKMQSVWFKDENKIDSDYGIDYSGTENTINKWIELGWDKNTILNHLSGPQKEYGKKRLEEIYASGK